VIIPYKTVDSLVATCNNEDGSQGLSLSVVSGNKDRGWAPSSDVYYYFKESGCLRMQYERNSHAVPLVYGVCRTASAPTLSHGGFRLNASKPEASPKTRCPKYHSSTLSLFAVCELRWINTINRIAFQNTVGSAGLVGAKYIT